MTEDENIKKVTEDIRSGIDLLRKSGRLDLLKDMLGDDLRNISLCDERKSVVLLEIKITDDMHIIVPEMDNMEIKMPTLARALYIFYLLHGEGVAFKQLGDYRKEILGIYRLASNRTDERKLTATVNRLVNPLDNKVNECASRIKDAFIKAFGEKEAEMYYLTNKDNDDNTLTKKCVKLPSSLISLPECLLKRI